MLLIVPAENSPLPVIPSPDDSSWRDHASTMEGSEVVVPPPGAATAQLQSFRDVVQVPEFRLIKRIGSGAYGEVWLAQSVTGAMRAVKIVWREDFELTKTFHREFLGIQQFEPISRGHPGLVHILHVGWNEERGYYYCVMELADDAEASAGGEEGWKTYVPRTLATDMRRHGRLDLHFCQEAGAFIADALHYMHQRGLTHRDIKPSNIIYCDNVCKLADIGLVATFGERSFVGTEGFVPPEGPGTPQADIYSLGKVLYEMSSGKDRMEFPEVPENLSETEWPFWKQFNRVICKACAPDLNERFQTAADFAVALRRLSEVEPPSLAAKVMTALGRTVLLLGTSFLAGGVWASYQHQEHWSYAVPVPGKPPPPKMFPTERQPWQSVYKQWFTYKKDHHVADLPVDMTLFNRYLDDKMRPFEGEVVQIKVTGYPIVDAVVVPAQDATDFCEWMTEQERKNKRLTDEFEYAWKPFRFPPSPNVAPPHAGWAAIQCELARVSYGRVVINTTPAPAMVFDGDTPMGNTPLVLPKVRAGNFEFEVRYPGYKLEMVKGAVKKSETKTFAVRLKNISAVVFGKPWENTLKMKFMPLGHAMLGATEVRRRDFREYVRAAKLPDVPERELNNEADLNKPVAFVSRAEAQGFCQWLTQKEQATEILEGEHSYRLPTDDEWSFAANLPRERGDSPAERHLRVDGIYPWGFSWPPLPKPGNLFDPAAAAVGKGPKVVPSHPTAVSGPAPVGSFRLDGRGLADLAGNVWEWVQDDYGGPDPAKEKLGIARGGSWNTKDREELLSSYRRTLAADTRVPDVGFRVLLSDGRPVRDEEP